MRYVDVDQSIELLIPSTWQWVRPTDVTGFCMDILMLMELVQCGSYYLSGS